MAWRLTDQRREAVFQKTRDLRNSIAHTARAIGHVGTHVLYILNVTIYSVSCLSTLDDLTLSLNSIAVYCPSYLGTSLKILEPEI